KRPLNIATSRTPPWLPSGNIGIGVLPEVQEILIGGLRFCRVPGDRIGARELQARQGTEREVQHDSAVIEEFLEFDRPRRSILLVQVRHAAEISRINGGARGSGWNAAVLVRKRRFQSDDRSIECLLRQGQ